MTEILYYRNCVNAVAISLDDGETVFTPEGRNIPLTPAWEWTDEDGLESLLSPSQTKAVEYIRSAPPLSEIAQLVETFHKRQLAAKKDYRQVDPQKLRRVRESVLAISSDPDD